MKRFGLLLFLTGSVFVFSGLTGCAQSPSGSVSETSSVAVESAADSAEMQISQSPTEGAASDDTVSSSMSEQAPQLIKLASLSLGVESVEESFKQVRAIVNAQQGDVFSMRDYGDRQRSIDFELRIPEKGFDDVLDALSALGEVRNRSITTEDVSGQLIDVQARLANARKSEEALQKIMSRSGEISDVLEVARELSNVRQSIERMAAEQKNLQTQVRYSTVSVSLQSVVTATPNKPGFSAQLATSWNEATESVGDLTTDLLQLGLWLLVYSPYLLVLACGGVLVNKARLSAQSNRSN